MQRAAGKLNHRGMDMRECCEAGAKHLEDKTKVVDESNTESSQ